MDFEAAVEELTFHCGSNGALDDPRWEAGFLQTLRTYRGLDVEAMEQVDACVDAVLPHLRSADCVDRRVINSLWGICHFARSWALHPDGMLPRNDLISAEDRKKLSDWLDGLSERIAFALDGAGEST